MPPLPAEEGGPLPSLHSLFPVPKGKTCLLGEVSVQSGMIAAREIRALLLPVLLASVTNPPISPTSCPTAEPGSSACG